MTENFWKDKYPAGIPTEINADQYPNIQSVLKESCQRFASKPAFSNMGKTLSYSDVYELSGAFAAYLQQHTDLQPGDRIAVQLPNVLQYPVVVFGALRAGLIVVNTTRCTPRGKWSTSSMTPVPRRWSAWPTWRTWLKKCCPRLASSMWW